MRVALLAAVLLPGASLHAQPGCDTSQVTVEGDLSKRQLDAIPFDVRFTIRTPVPDLREEKLEVDSVVLRYGSPIRVAGGFGLPDDALRSTAFVLGAAPPTELTFFVQPLRPNRRQYFDFFVYAPQPRKVETSTPARTDTLKVVTFNEENLTFTVNDSVVKRDSIIQVSVAIDTIRIVGTPRATFADHFDADAGLLYAPGFGYWGAGTNSHVYARPVNRNQCTRDYRGWDRLFKRVSLFGGLSLFEIDSGPEVDHLWSTGSPVVGIGVNRIPRVPIRFNVGIIWLRQDDPNPLVTESIVKRDLFFSGTIDFELQQLVTPLATLVGLSK